MEKLSGIKLVVFDLDGTLVDTFEDIRHSVNFALLRLGRPPLSLEDVKARVGGGGYNLMRRCLGGEPSEEEVRQGFELWTSYYDEHPADHSRVYPYAKETLRHLKHRGIKTAVLSNKLDTLTVQVVTNLGLAEFLDAVQGELLDQPRKPDPALILRLMMQFNAGENQTLMVGDGDADMKVAQNTGIRAIGVSYGVQPAAALTEMGAIAVIDSLSELPALLQ